MATGNMQFGQNPSDKSFQRCPFFGFQMDFLTGAENHCELLPLEDSQIDLTSLCESEETQLEQQSQIKQDLKRKIQDKYLSQGKRPLSVSFEPAPRYELTAEEKMKQEKRKTRNRESANKSRVKRKMYEDELKKNLKELESDNVKLQKEVEWFRAYEHKLRVTFTKHLLKCTDPEKRAKMDLLKQQKMTSVKEPESAGFSTTGFSFPGSVPGPYFTAKQ